MQTRTCESGEPRAFKAHRSPRCRERSFGSLRSVKFFLGVFEKKERFLARRGSAIGLPCSAALVLASLVSIPFFVFKEKRKKKTRSPSCFFLLLLLFFFRVFSPQSFPVALELRRVGVGHRGRITVGADAAELQGPWSAPEPRPRLSSLFCRPSSFQLRAYLVQTRSRTGRASPRSVRSDWVPGVARSR